jgi:RNA polymerase sigma-70 factor (ECF subfamily)
MIKKGTDLEDLVRCGYRYAYSLTHHTADAEDLVQQACAKLWKRYGRLTPKALLYRSIRNAFYDQCRRQKCIRFEPLDHEPVAATLPMKDEELHAALSSLTSEDREWVYLMSVEGMTAQELAERTGKSRNTILSRIRRAKLHLREQLGDENGERCHG